MMQLNQTINKLVLTLFTVLSITLAQAQTLESVLKDHFEATGQNKLVKSTAIKASGKMVQMGLEIPFQMYQKRDNMIRVEGTFQGQTFIQVFDGKEGWTINPFTGSTAAQPMGPQELKDMKMQSDMDGMLWNWKEKGYNVSYEGTEAIEGTECFKLKAETVDGDVYVYFIDTESLMAIKLSSKIKIQDVFTESETYMSNFMQIDGIALPGKIESKFDGQTASTIVVESYTMNADINNSLFLKPSN